MKGLEKRNNLAKEAKASTLANLFLPHICVLICWSVTHSPVQSGSSLENTVYIQQKDSWAQVRNSLIWNNICYAFQSRSCIITEVGWGQVSVQRKVSFSPSALCLGELSCIWWCLLPSSENELNYRFIFRVLQFSRRKRQWNPLQYSCLENPMEPGGLQSMGSVRVRHDWATSLWLFTFMHWRRKWQPTPVFLPGESQGRGSLVGCRLWGLTESDMTEAT